MVEIEDDSSLFIYSTYRVTEGDSSNFAQSVLQTNTTIGCGHQLFKKF